jgi:alkylation response protein AidB-like acyl-CoA dehydrogenase
MMDFGYSEDQQSVRDLARQIFATEVSEASLKVVEQGGPWLHRPLWEALAQAELLGVAVPGEFGGAGMGLLELCLL